MKLATCNRVVKSASTFGNQCPYSNRLGQCIARKTRKMSMLHQTRALNEQVEARPLHAWTQQRRLRRLGPASAVLAEAATLKVQHWIHCSLLRRIFFPGPSFPDSFRRKFLVVLLFRFLPLCRFLPSVGLSCPNKSFPWAREQRKLTIQLEQKCKGSISFSCSAFDL